MANFKKTQLLKLSLIATLLCFTPFLSSSFRSTYLYLIINVLILVLVAEAGFLSPFSSPSSSEKTLEVDKKSTTNNTKVGTNNARVVWVIDDEEDNKGVSREKIFDGNYVSEKVIVCVGEVKNLIKKCPSIPSIFYIGGSDENENENEADLAEEKQLDEDEKEKGVYDEGQEELFVKAETFIVNFYKQLKMQKEESLKNFNELINENCLLTR